MIMLDTSGVQFVLVAWIAIVTTISLISHYIHWRKR